MKKSAPICIAALMGLAAPLPIAAQQSSQSAEEIVRQLVPPRTRSVSISPETRGIKVEGRKTENASLNLYINFDYDSDKLKQDALIQLDHLATALQDEKLADFEFLIAGHTDAAGSDEYNMSLSERRAGSVKEYLVSRHGVPANRLVEKGFGESRLLDPDDPEGSENRRVQIITLSTP